jgi:pumilio family protein 6
MTKAAGTKAASAANSKKAKRAARKLEKKGVARSLSDAVGMKKGDGKNKVGGHDKAKKFQKPSSAGKSFNKDGSKVPKPADGISRGGDGNGPPKKRDGKKNYGGQDDKKRKHSAPAPGGSKKPAAPGKDAGDGKWNYKRSKPNAALVQNLNQNWNKVRVKNIKPEERTAIVNGMMQQLDKHLLEVTLRHDASRAVQSVIQFGTPAQRVRVLEGIQSKFSEVTNYLYKWLFS